MRRDKHPETNGKSIILHTVIAPYFLVNTPCKMNTPETEKIIGHSLYGRKSTRNPVNNDRIAKENNIPIIKI